MGLRLKTTLLMLALVVPLTTAFSIQRLMHEHRLLKERRANNLATRTAINLHERLLAKPNRCTRPMWHKRIHQRMRARGFDAYLYDGHFGDARDGAPTFSPQLRKLLDANTELFEPVHLWSWTHKKLSGATAVRIHEGIGPCSILWLGWTARTKTIASPIWHRVGTQTLLLVLMLLCTGTVLTFPLVRRIRKLTEAVKRAPKEDWKVYIEPRSSDEIDVLARAFMDLGAQVAQTIEALEERDRTLKQYISNTTHDLAIPLTVLQHRLRAMQTKLHQGDAVAPKELDTTIEESHYIGALIANMSAGAKLEAGATHMKHHEVSLSDLVERVVARHEPIAEQKGLEINFSTPDEDITTQGDSTLLEQALSNLVQNAVQYHNKEGGHVSVVLETSSQHNTFEIRVMDDGKGVPQDFLDHMSTRSARGDDARSRNPGGQGFGLSIANRVCAQHGMTLRFDNEPQGGLRAIMCGARS